MPPRLTFRRTRDDNATDLGYTLENGAYAAVRVLDTADSATVAAQLRALAARIEPSPNDSAAIFTARRQKR